LEELQIAKATPGQTFPDIGQYSDSSPTHLGTGGFGDTWKAWDKTRASYVAIKIFYSQDKYVSPDTANQREKRMLFGSRKECADIRNIVRSASTMGTPYNDYAQFLCQCYADHAGEGGAAGEPAFLVLELCGKDILSGVIGPASNQPPKGKAMKDFLRKGRHIIKDVLKGLALLQNLEPPLMHHDIKPQNICVTDDGTGKLIDFGGLMRAEAVTMKTGAVYTPVYRPPELSAGPKAGWAWDGEPWSYDIYSLGLVYTQLLCPPVTPEEWIKVLGPRTLATTTAWSPRHVISAQCPEVAETEPSAVSLVEKMIMPVPDFRPSPLSCMVEVGKLDTEK